ncbi:hypothetical protein ACOMHN_026536 [Nucella lapillus]
MRLKCEIDVVLRPLDGCNVRKTGRPSQALITVGKEGGSQSKNAQINMLISTGKNRNGTKYQLSGNIMRLYARFVDEGKGTISLVNPAQDICISKADPIQLKSMLTILRMVAKGEDISKCMTVKSIQPPSATGMKALQTTMVVTSRREYPLTTSFPSALQNLTVTGCTMKRLDPRIRDLRHLRMLNLSSNVLSTLPDNLTCWRHLSDLDLSSNNMSSVPAALYRACVKDSLTVLKLNNNGLTELPPQICWISGLVQLHVDDNKLPALPPTIGSLSRLFSLSAQRNQITQLPGGITRLRLESLDLFGNPIQEVKDSELLSSNVGVSSLLEVTARFIRGHRLTYTEEDLLPHLIFYLDNARQCWCGQYCFQSCARYLRKCELSELSSTVQAWNVLGNTTVPVETFLCSATCLEKFQKNPFAYWR